MPSVKRLRVVDDMASVRALVSAIGRDCRYEPQQAANGEQALACCQTTQFDAIVCDWNMPRMNGEEFVLNLRLTDRDTPVIMLTAENDRGKLLALADVGISGYILEPFKPETLFRLLRKLDRRRATRPLAD